MKSTNLIIGTGPAGIATAMAFRRQKIPFEVIDVAYDLETDIQQQVDDLASKSYSSWDKTKIKSIFPPSVASINGVEKRLSFGSDFPYRVPDNLQIETEDCDTQLSHGIGGFGNVWGGAMLPYNDYALKDWPISINELKASYKNVTDYVPLSAEDDGLQEYFPIYSNSYTALERPQKFQYMLSSFAKHEKKLKRDGIEFGRARLAVDSSEGSKKCRQCGLCLDGCVYGSLFNPRLLWRKLEQEGVKIHKGYYAQEFNETNEGVIVKTFNINDRSIKKWETKRLYLATGQFATTKIIAKSLGHYDEKIKISDSQYFFFPYFSYRGMKDKFQFTLAEMFVEILNHRISQNYVHVQAYGMNKIVEQTLRDIIPAPIPLKIFVDRLHIFQGFLNSEDSGHLELTLKRSMETEDKIYIKGVENKNSFRIAKNIQSLLRKKLLGMGIVPPGNLKLVSPGRSFHAGGSFPMGGGHSLYSSDTLGRPAGLKRVHIVDSANFPNINGSTIIFTIMANADRIVNECSSKL